MSRFALLSSENLHGASLRFRSRKFQDFRFRSRLLELLCSISYAFASLSLNTFWRNLHPCSSLLESAKTPVFIIYTIVYVVSSNRARTISGWMYPWLQWTYALNSTETEIEEHVSGILDVYGYLTFAAPLFALMPELILRIILWIQKGFLILQCPLMNRWNIRIYSYPWKAKH